MSGMKLDKLFFVLITLLVPVPISAQQINWFTDYKTAMAAAKESGKPVLMDFTAEWCKPCKAMDASFWVKPDIIKLSERFVCVKVDLDASKKLAQKYGVHSIPNVIVTDSWGTALVSNRGYTGNTESEITRKLGLVPADFNELKEAWGLLETNKDDLASLNKFAVFYDQRKFYSQSNEYSLRILKLETDPLKRENLLLKLGTNYLMSGFQDEALDIFEKFQKEFPNSPQMDKVLFAQIVAYEREDDIKKAQKALTGLRAKFPDSVFAAEAEKLIAQHIPKKSK